MKIEVSGRICLFGEHSDWAATYREINKNIYQHIEENREERIYETKKYILATSEEMDNGWERFS